MQDIFQICKSNIFQVSERLLAEISENCLCEMSYIAVHEMSFRQLCKISSRFGNPTFFRCMKDILPRCLECFHKTSLRHLKDVFLPTGQMFHRVLICLLVKCVSTQKGVQLHVISSVIRLKFIVDLTCHCTTQHSILHKSRSLK